MTTRQSAQQGGTEWRGLALNLSGDHDGSDDYEYDDDEDGDEDGNDDEDGDDDADDYMGGILLLAKVLITHF